MRYLIPTYVKMQSKLESMLRNEEGATMVEYALMVTLIAVVAAAIVGTVGTNIKAAFTTLSTNIHG